MLSSILVVAAIATATPVAAVPFDGNSFEALQKQGKAVVVLVSADWCPTCRAQDAALHEILTQPQFTSLSVLRVDFDKQKDVVKSLKARSQSTLIVFKGGKEVARTVGDTDKERLADLLKRVI